MHRGIERDREQGAKLAPIANQLTTVTQREGEVLTRVIAGRLNKQIAGELGISEKTEKVHRGRAMAKMGVHTVADLVRTVEPTLIHLLSEGPMPDPDGRAGAQQASLPSGPMARSP